MSVRGGVQQVSSGEEGLVKGEGVTCGAVPAEVIHPVLLPELIQPELKGRAGAGITGVYQQHCALPTCHNTRLEEIGNVTVYLLPTIWLH